MDEILEYHFGDTLRRIRKAKELNQSDLAEMTGYTQTNISALENQRGMPRGEVIIVLSEALDIPISQLLPTVESGLSGEELQLLYAWQDKRFDIILDMIAHAMRRA